MDIVDQYSDPGFEKLASVTADETMEAVRGAAGGFAQRPTTPYSMAWKEAALFPVHTPEDAVVSLLYAVKQARHVPGEVFARIKEAVDAYGYDAVSLVQEAAEVQTVKEASADEFLLPERRRLRVKVAEDIPEAVFALERYGRQLTVQERSASAVRLVEKAAQFKSDVSSLPVSVYKYAGLVESDKDLLVESLGARAAACRTLAERGVYDKIARTVSSGMPQRNRAELVKIAQLIEVADTAANIKGHYGKRLLDPMLAVFNTDKLASNDIDMGSGRVSVMSLMKIPKTMYSDALGEDFLSEVVDESGELSAELLGAVLPTLPADMKRQFMASAGAYLK